MNPIDFNSDVIARSRSVPVVVDFWAPWCGPCRTLGPTIERLAEAASGRWELVKLNTEQQPDVAQAFGIMSIPAVKMFHGGEIVAEFVGALPEQAIRAWLDQHLPDPTIDELWSIAARWVELGEAITSELEAWVAEHGDSELGRALLALSLATREPARSRELLGSVRGDAEVQELVEDVTALLELVELGDDLPDKVAPHFAAARTALIAHDLDDTLEHLVDAAMADRRFGNELARRAAVALFNRLGQDSDLTRQHRRRLSMALHV